MVLSRQKVINFAVEEVATCELLSVEEGGLSGIGWQTLMGEIHNTLCELEIAGLKCANIIHNILLT